MRKEDFLNYEFYVNRILKNVEAIERQTIKGSNSSFFSTYYIMVIKKDIDHKTSLYHLKYYRDKKLFSSRNELLHDCEFFKSEKSHLENLEYKKAEEWSNCPQKIFNYAFNEINCLFVIEHFIGYNSKFENRDINFHPVFISTVSNFNFRPNRDETKMLHHILTYIDSNYEPHYSDIEPNYVIDSELFESYMDNYNHHDDWRDYEYDHDNDSGDYFVDE
jgi:hypothetical protein